MTLRAKKPEIQNNRLRCLIYGEANSGKSHFCCTFPKTYYIDTEGLVQYKKYVKMLNKNESPLVELSEMDEIIKEVTQLLTSNHDYSTLVIDSLTNIYIQACDSEAERLAKKGNSKNAEGTEFQAHLNKPKRKIMRLANLLSRLDMNILVTCHAKVKYEDGKQVGYQEDMYDKLKYILGSSVNIFSVGGKRKGRFVKSRYEELPEGEVFDISYEYFEEKFGRENFLKDCSPQELITDDQLSQLQFLFTQLHIDEEVISKGVAKANATNLKDISKEKASAWIDHLVKKVNPVCKSEVKNSENKIIKMING